MKEQFEAMQTSKPTEFELNKQIIELYEEIDKLKQKQIE